MGSVERLELYMSTDGPKHWHNYLTPKSVDSRVLEQYTQLYKDFAGSVQRLVLYVSSDGLEHWHNFLTPKLVNSRALEE